MKLPHWVQVALMLMGGVLTTVIALTKSGDIVLPAAVLQALLMISTVIGLFSSRVGAETLQASQLAGPIVSVKPENKP